MSDPIDRGAAIDIVMHYGKKIPTYAIACKAGLEKLPSAQPTHDCDTCRYRNLEWSEEPCDSCTSSGVSSHWKPSAHPEPEHTMEEFMYGQDLGSPEDGSL